MILWLLAIKKEGNYPKEWYDNEIKATDELLEKHST